MSPESTIKPDKPRVITENITSRRESCYCLNCGGMTEHKIDSQDIHMIRPRGEFHKRETHSTCLTCWLTTTNKQNL